MHRSRKRAGATLIKTGERDEHTIRRFVAESDHARRQAVGGASAAGTARRASAGGAADGIGGLALGDFPRHLLRAFPRAPAGQSAPRLVRSVLACWLSGRARILRNS